MLNPPVRYVITSDKQVEVANQLESWSDLKTGGLYRQLQGYAPLVNKRILVERHRDRGIGDLLFMTGPLAWLQHVNSYMCQIYFYTEVQRGAVLHGNQNLVNDMPMAGPVVYDTLPLYQAHWFSESATEYDEEVDQLNVYDALYAQLGVDYSKVGWEYKVPKVLVYAGDHQRADDLFHQIYQERGIDLRLTPYWVLAPLSNSTLRSAPYGLWLDIARELARQRVPVLLFGSVNSALIPSTDRPFEAFYQELSELSRASPYVINLLGGTPIRLLVGVISKARGVVSLDSGLLYVAQGLRRPAVSLWGSHSPTVRIGYDHDYMQHAVHLTSECAYSPCYAYRGFPVGKCPLGERQQVCAPLSALTLNHVIPHMEKIAAAATVSVQVSRPASGK